ncbi:MAG: hypothetical protein WKF95_14150 [Rubrobacter sp.]
MAAAALTGALGPSSDTTGTTSGSAPDGEGGGGGAASSPPGDDFESTVSPEETTVPAEDPAFTAGDPHPAFDPLLLTLAEMTSAPIVLPSDLPTQFQDVAIDETSEGGGYALLFLDDQAETGEIVQPFVDAWVDGTLEAAPVEDGEPELPDYGPDFEITSGEALTFTDGAVGAYNCYGPSSGTGPFCVGAHTKGHHRYTLSLEGPTPPEEEMEAMLSSMVPAGVSSPEPTSATASPEPDPGDAEAEAEEAAGEYYRAAGVEDWDYTYDNLDSETQALFSEEGWSDKNQWFADNGEVIYHIESVERLGSSSSSFVGVTMRLTYEDGTSSSRDTFFVYEDGAWRHSFGQEERDLFMPELSYEEFVAAQ